MCSITGGEGQGWVCVPDMECPRILWGAHTSVRAELTPGVGDSGSWNYLDVPGADFGFVLR